MRFFENEWLSNLLHAVVAVPFGLAVIAIVSQVLVHAA